MLMLHPMFSLTYYCTILLTLIPTCTFLSENTKCTANLATNVDVDVQ